VARTIAFVNETDELKPQDISTAEAFPWPPRAGSSWLDALAATWQQACFDATSFFKRMPRAGDYGPVIIYYLIIGVAVAGIKLFWTTVFGSLEFSHFIADRFGADFPEGNAVVDFLVSPFFLLCALYLVSGVCHLVLMMSRGAKHGFETTTRVFAFSYSPMLFAAVPMIGTLAGLIWMVRIAIVGLREAHEIDGAKAAVAVLIPLFLAFCFILLGALAALTMGLLNTRL
jgi:hypothetical protein